MNEFIANATSSSYNIISSKQLEQRLNSMEAQLAQTNAFVYGLLWSQHLENLTVHEGIVPCVEGETDMARLKALVHINGEPAWATGATPQAFADNIVKKVGHFVATNKESPLFENMAKKWYSLYWQPKEGGLINTWKNVRTMIFKRAIPFFKGYKINEIVQSDIQAYINWCKKDGLSSASSLNKAWLYTKQVFDMAVDDGIIGKNPAANKKKLDLNGEKTERFALNDEQVHSICKALQGLPAKDALLVYMPLFVGTRRGETLGLKWADIDWAEGTIKVDRAIHFIDGQPHEGPPKTKAAYRTIPLLKELRDILEPLKGEPQQYIVSGDDAITESSYVRAWQRIKKKVHLFDATAHTLRHTYSTFIAQQLIPKEHQTVMGHSDLETTMKVYTHVDQERLTQKYKAIGSLYIVA